MQEREAKTPPKAFLFFFFFVTLSLFRSRFMARVIVFVLCKDNRCMQLSIEVHTKRGTPPYPDPLLRVAPSVLHMFTQSDLSRHFLKYAFMAMQVFDDNSSRGPLMLYYSKNCLLPTFTTGKPETKSRPL